LAFRALCSDLAADGYGWTVSLAPRLDEVLPIVADPLPIADIWTEIEGHVRVAIAPYGALLDGPPVLDESAPDDVPSRALVDLLLWHLDHPVQAIARAAARAIGELLLANDPDIGAAVDDALRRPEGDHTPI